MLDWSGHVRSWVIESCLNVHVLKYEDMIDDPFSAFSESLTFLNLTYSKEKLSSAIINSDFEVLENIRNKLRGLLKSLSTLPHSSEKELNRIGSIT